MWLLRCVSRNAEHFVEFADTCHFASAFSCVGCAILFVCSCLLLLITFYFFWCRFKVSLNSTHDNNYRNQHICIQFVFLHFNLLILLFLILQDLFAFFYVVYYTSFYSSFVLDSAGFICFCLHCALHLILFSFNTFVLPCAGLIFRCVHCMLVLIFFDIVVFHLAGFICLSLCCMLHVIFFFLCSRFCRFHLPTLYITCHFILVGIFVLHFAGLIFFCIHCRPHVILVSFIFLHVACFICFCMLCHVVLQVCMLCKCIILAVWGLGFRV